MTIVRDAYLLVRATGADIEIDGAVVVSGHPQQTTRLPGLR
jgi:hypothetical protein